MRSHSFSSSSSGAFLVLLAVVLGLFAAAGSAVPNWDICEIDGDGIDNDGDGYTDSEDTECGSHYEGFGSGSVGGAGGTVFWVDPAIGDVSPGSDPHSGTHADPCGLRKALDGSNRVIKFIAGGTITMNSKLYIRGSYITIDGFTTPAPGVTITQTHATHGGIGIAPRRDEHGHDYILNHLRFDGLWDEDPSHAVGWFVFTVDGDVGDSKVTDLILDHLTIRDDQDKVTIWGKVERITISECFFYHSGKALLVSWYTPPPYHLKSDLSIHHNVFAENNERNPQWRGYIRNMDFVNNVTFGWGYSDWGFGLRMANHGPPEESIDANIRNNYFKSAYGYANQAIIYGPNPGWDGDENGPPNPPLSQDTVYTQSDMGNLYVRGNILPPQNLDHYSTIPDPLPIPAWAQVTMIPADQLYTIVSQVGMQYKDVRGQGVIDRVMAGIGPEVYGRYVFYNDSAFDGNDSGANASDDGAIAPDKSALLAGGTATFANYTSYASGINGIMIDIPSLPGTPTASDFTFKVGNDSSPGGWASAPAPSSVTVRAGEGAGGSDRVTILWTNNTIEKQWLQVTVLATANTGLSSPDVFHFGNAIGETGNSPSDAEVTPTDEIDVRNNPHTLGQNPATITDTCDFNRDRKVGPADAIICRNNGTNSMTALQLITVP